MMISIRMLRAGTHGDGNYLRKTEKENQDGKDRKC
jgi:hypothetical protein